MDGVVDGVMDGEVDGVVESEVDIEADADDSGLDVSDGCVCLGNSLSKKGSDDPESGIGSAESVSFEVCELFD